MVNVCDGQLHHRARMSTGEHAVAPVLRDYFSCVWVNRLSATAPASIVVVPDGTIDLQWITNHWRIAGPDKQPQTELLPDGTVVVGFRFQPGAATEWLRVPASELCNRRIFLRDIAGSFGARVGTARRTRRAVADERPVDE
jgi:hypothetical protein